MKNENTAISRLKKSLQGRWVTPDVPGGDGRFQTRLFALDVFIFVIFPLSTALFFKAATTASTKKAKGNSRVVSTTSPGKQQSQIISFFEGPSGVAEFSHLKMAPGSLVKVRLLNYVEGLSVAPVHAQIVDNGLGENFLGGTLIGEASTDTSVQRMNIAFTLAKLKSRVDIAYPIAARGLSLDGTFGLDALKGGGFAARSAFASAGLAKNNIGGPSGAGDLKSLLIKALTGGLLQEVGTVDRVETNRAQILVLQAGMEFFAELTDYFPSGKK